MGKTLRNKTSSEVSKAFKSIIEDRKPKKVQYDQGIEFKNKEFQKLLREYDIISYEARNDTKAAIVERFNRTFKNKMYRYLTAENTLQYIDVLQDLMESYNNTYHRSIKMKPINVNEDNEKKVHKTLFPINRMKAKSKYKIGDYVRLFSLRYPSNRMDKTPFRLRRMRACSACGGVSICCGC